MSAESQSNRAFRKPAPKKAVVSLIERDGRARSFHVANVTSKTVRTIIVTNADRKSALMTDESTIYTKVGREFASHDAVDHSRNEYAYHDKKTDRTVSINASENFYSIFKRGIIGVYHSISEAHLHRYLKEFDFRYSNRSGLRHRRCRARPQSDHGRRRQAVDLSSACYLSGPTTSHGSRQRSPEGRLTLGVVAGSLRISFCFWRAVLVRLS